MPSKLLMLLNLDIQTPAIESSSARRAREEPASEGDAGTAPSAESTVPAAPLPRPVNPVTAEKLRLRALKSASGGLGRPSKSVLTLPGSQSRRPVQEEDPRALSGEDFHVPHFEDDIIPAPDIQMGEEDVSRTPAGSDLTPITSDAEKEPEVRPAKAAPRRSTRRKADALAIDTESDGRAVADGGVSEHARRVAKKQKTEARGQSTVAQEATPAGGTSRKPSAPRREVVDQAGKIGLAVRRAPPGGADVLPKSRRGT